MGGSVGMGLKKFGGSCDDDNEDEDEDDCVVDDNDVDDDGNCKGTNAGNFNEFIPLFLPNSFSPSLLRLDFWFQKKKFNFFLMICKFLIRMVSRIESLIELTWNNLQGGHYSGTRKEKKKGLKGGINFEVSYLKVIHNCKRIVTFYYS